MSSLFSVFEGETLKKDIKKLIIPTKPAADDPILGPTPEIVYQWNTFAKKHGALVEKVMTKVIQHAPGWEAASQTRFKCDTSETKNLIDRIAICRKHDIAIFIECKRNLGNVSGPYLGKIKTYNSWVYENSDAIANELRFRTNDPLIAFCVFNAYGDLSAREIVKGIPVIRPSDLSSIFGTFVFKAFNEFNGFVYSTLLEHDALRDMLSKNDPQLATLDTSVRDHKNADVLAHDFREVIKTKLRSLTYVDH